MEDYFRDIHEFHKSSGYEKLDDLLKNHVGEELLIIENREETIIYVDPCGPNEMGIRSYKYYGIISGGLEYDGTYRKFMMDEYATDDNYRHNWELKKGSIKFITIRLLDKEEDEIIRYFGDKKKGILLYVGDEVRDYFERLDDLYDGDHNRKKYLGARKKLGLSIPEDMVLLDEEEVNKRLFSIIKKLYEGAEKSEAEDCLEKALELKALDSSNSFELEKGIICKVSEYIKNKCEEYDLN